MAQALPSGALPPVLVVLLGLVVHVILTYSVIDIHFQTPIVQGISPQPMHHPGPAKRVVVIVADGLRADKLFEADGEGQPRSPWLRQQALQHGRFGISHTRPPTESRPGHVAMLAGFYEDPSALFSGWQVNPVAFDSVFNHSTASWGFGSPDVVPMFEGQQGYTWDAYAAELEDFGRDDLTVLDVWTFNRTYALLEEVATNASHPLRTGPAILFLHLLGLDSNAHAHGGPSCKQYLDNIRLVDQLTARFVKHLDMLFGDAATAYLYTADHGMSDQASHGDGSPQNTHTPYVVWGAGVAQHSSDSSSTGSSGGSSSKQAAVMDWGYDSPARMDIEQAQLAPLVSALLGTPCPVNSIGLLPSQLLGGSPAFRAHAAWANARQLLAAHDKKEELVQSGSLRYVAHRGLSQLRILLDPAIEAALQQGEYDKAQHLAQQLAAEALAGIEYLQRYDRPMLMGTVTLGFLGWMCYIMLQLTLAGRAAQAHAQAAAHTLATRGPAGTGSDAAGGWGGMYVLPSPAGKPKRTAACASAPTLAAGAAADAATDCSGAAMGPPVAAAGTGKDARIDAAAPSATSVPADGAVLRRHAPGPLTSARPMGACLMALAFALLARMGAPLTYYAYAVLPCVFWTEVLHRRGVWASVLSSALATPRQRLRLATELSTVTALLLAMAAGFKWRSLYSLITPLAALLAVAASPARSHPAAAQLLLSFTAVGAFTLVPTGKSLANGVVAVTGAAAAVGVLLLTRSRSQGREPSKHRGSSRGAAPMPLLTQLQLGAVAAAGVVVLLAKKGATGPLQALLHATAWALFLGCPLLPLASAPQWRHRWRALLLGLLPPFMLVSLCWEPLFYAAMALAVHSWLGFDAAAQAAAAAGNSGCSGSDSGSGSGNTSADGSHANGTWAMQPAEQPAAAAAPEQDEGAEARQQHRRQRKPHPLWVDEPPDQQLQQQQQQEQQQHSQRWKQAQPVSDWADVHNALLFLLLIQLGFFGQGNTATVASFDLASVYRLVTRFNPFAMTAILLLKLFIPFVLATAGLCMLALRSSRQRFSLYLLVLLLGDVMALKFFFAVRSEGSWMEIGSSLGFYGIMNAQVVCLLLLLLLTQAYIHNVVPGDA